MEKSINTIIEVGYLKEYIDELEKQINHLEYPIRAAGGSSMHGSEPGNPTEKSALKLQELREKLRIKLDEYLEEYDEMISWIISWDDRKAQVMAIRRMDGMIWEDIAKLENMSDRSVAYHYVERYIKKLG